MKHNKITLPVLLFLLCSCANGGVSSSSFSSSSSSEISSSSSSSEVSSSSSEYQCVHEPKIIKGYPATCTKEGFTDGSICAKCGKLLQPQERIAKLPHDYKLISISIDEENVLARKSQYSCSVCEKEHKASLENKDINNMPIIEINGDISGISKENEVDVNVNYLDEKHPFTSIAKLKYQGSSSLSYDKKNFNITFYNEKGKKNKVTVKDSWGKQSKYTLKANWVDYSHARNVVSGQMFSTIVHERDIQDELAKLPNGGVVDGFPVVIYINNAYQGIYTLNIPKNKWMFGMDGEDVSQALLMGNLHHESIYLNEPVKDDFSNGWELEYCSTEDTTGTKWVVDSMNSLISFLNSAGDIPFKAFIKDYCLVERTIDAMIFSNFICAGDNFAKNILWATYDGVKWYPSLYDLDGTWGMMYNGINYYSDSTFLPDQIVAQNNCNLLWKRLYKCFMPEIKSRYFELRESILTEENINNTFEAFFDSIPNLLRTTELQKWPNIPRPDKNTLSQIESWAKNRIVNYDNYFKAQ